MDKRNTPARRSYRKKLLDPRWQKKRLKVLERDDWACKSCGAKKRTLHVHHLGYAASGNPWDVEDVDLVTLCDQCHQYESDMMPLVLPEVQRQLKRVFLSDGMTDLLVALSCVPSLSVRKHDPRVDDFGSLLIHFCRDPRAAELVRQHFIETFEERSFEGISFDLLQEMANRTGDDEDEDMVAARYAEQDSGE